MASSPCGSASGGSGAATTTPAGVRTRDRFTRGAAGASSPAVAIAGAHAALEHGAMALFCAAVAAAPPPVAAPLPVAGAAPCATAIVGVLSPGKSVAAAPT